MSALFRHVSLGFVWVALCAAMLATAAHAGELVWYKHQGQSDGTARWAGPKTVGSGWGGFKHVGATSGGVLYAVNASGDLLWYRHDGRGDGQANWGASAGNKVGNGWDSKTVLASSGGVLYTIAADGALRWFKHSGAGGGSVQWGAGAGSAVGSGWGGFKHVVAAADGVFYAVDARDQLLWFKHTGRDNGTASWAPGTGNVVGTGWGGFKHLFAGPGGVLYAINGAGALLWYKHLGRDNGTASWAPGTGNVVGTGWGDFARVFAGDDGVIYVVKPGGAVASSSRPVAAPAPTPGLSDSMVQLRGDPESVFMPHFMSRPEIQGPLNGALSKVGEAEGKLREVLGKLKALASDAGGALGQWKSKRVCVPKSVTVKGSCKAHAQECARFALPRCSSRCTQTVWPGVCVRYENFNCSSPCEAWRSTSTCLVWWPDSVRIEDTCADVPYFDPTEGSVWKSAREAAEKELAAAREAFERVKRETLEKGRRAFQSAVKRATEMAGAAWDTVSRAATDLYSKASAGARAVLEKVFELAGTTAVELLGPLFAKSANELAARETTNMSRHATWFDQLLPARRRALAACEAKPLYLDDCTKYDLTSGKACPDGYRRSGRCTCEFKSRDGTLESPLRQLRTLITQSATKALGAIKQVLGLSGNWTKLMDVAERERWRFVAHERGKIAKAINKGANWIGKLLRLEQLMRFVEYAKKDATEWATKNLASIQEGFAKKSAALFSWSKQKAAKFADWITNWPKLSKWLDEAAESLATAGKSISSGAKKLADDVGQKAIEALAWGLRKARQMAPKKHDFIFEFVERHLSPDWETFKGKVGKLMASSPKSADDAGKVAFKTKLANGWTKLKKVAGPVLARMGGWVASKGAGAAAFMKKAATKVKGAAKKIGLGPVMVALQWLAVGAAYPYAHYECFKSPTIQRDAYKNCYVEKFTDFTRQAMFDALVGTAVELLDKPLIMPLAMGVTAAVSAAVALAFTPATAATSGAVMGMATRFGVTILLTVFADHLFPWYTANIWTPNLSYFIDRAEEGASLYWKYR